MRNIQRLHIPSVDMQATAWYRHIDDHQIHQCLVQQLSELRAFNIARGRLSHWPKHDATSKHCGFEHDNDAVTGGMYVSPAVGIHSSPSPSAVHSTSPPAWHAHEPAMPCSS